MFSARVCQVPVWIAGLLVAAFLTAERPAAWAQQPSVNQLAAALAAAIQKEDYEEARALIARLASAGDEKAAGVIVQTLAKGEVRAEEIQQAANDALVQLGVEHCAEVFDRVLQRRNSPLVQIATVVAVAARLPGDKPAEWLVHALGTRDYFLYRNAIPPLIERRSKEAIPALIGLLERIGFAPSSESYMVRDALIALTGQDFENLPDWRKWWGANKETFDPKSLDEATGRTGVARKMPGGFRQPKFFGVEVRSDRVVFVVDVSGSMAWYDDTAEQIGEGPEHRTKERLARLKHHLARTIEELPEWTYFNIIAFSDVNRLFNPKGAVRADSRTKARALEFVQQLRAFGPTHTDDALTKAFEDLNVDTIILLSDGAPVRAQKKTKDLIQEIHERVAKLNLLAKVKIFALGFEGEPRYPPGMAPPPGGKPDPDAPTIQDLIDFLKKLAADHGGEYHPIR